MSPLHIATATATTGVGSKLAGMDCLRRQRHVLVNEVRLEDQEDEPPEAEDDLHDVNSAGSLPPRILDGAVHDGVLEDVVVLLRGAGAQGGEELGAEDVRDVAHLDDTVPDGLAGSGHQRGVPRGRLEFGHVVPPSDVRLVKGPRLALGVHQVAHALAEAPGCEAHAARQRVPAHAFADGLFQHAVQESARSLGALLNHLRQVAPRQVRRHRARGDLL
mmetsp:Transcript_123129/g.394295  ORF Transcript_123129/g.394295 Transcript_123129/m.394295 type:complete len:218 (+) Transcript_123129:1230-1883(+)